MAVIIIACLCNALVLRNAFTQDDIAILQESSRLHGFGMWREILSQPYWPPPASPDLYRPFLSLLLAAQHAIGDGATLPFRLTSLAIHAGASVGVLLLARRMMAPDFALGVAILFAAHPVHVEAIALAVGQGELVVGLLATLMTAAYLDWRREGGGDLRIRHWVLLGIGAIAAGLSKENGLMIPLILVAAELLVVRARADVRRSPWMGLASVAVAAALVVAARSAVLAGRLEASMVAEALQGQGVGGRLLTMLRVVPEWLRLFVWPRHLRADYSPREFVTSTGMGLPELLGLILIAASIALAVRFRRRSATVTFGLAWTAIALAPVSNLVLATGVLLAERTLYLPSIGVLLALGGLVSLARERIETRRAWRLAAIAAVGVVVVAAGVRSASRFQVWRNPRTLTLFSVADAPLSWRVQQSYGEFLFEEGRIPEGKAAFERSIEYAPASWRPRNRFAERLWSVRDDAAALAQLEKSLAEHPGRIETLMRLPAALLAVGRYEQAGRLADSIIVAEHSPPMMVAYKVVADSAKKLNAPVGSVRVFPRR